MPLELTLAKWNKLAVMLSAYELYLFIKSVNRDEKVVYFRNKANKDPHDPNDSQLVTIASCLLLLDTVILTLVAFIWLTEIKQQFEQENPIESNINIPSEYPFGMVDTSLTAIGVQKKALDEPVTIA